jgi:hypothetical protein
VTKEERLAWQREYRKQTNNMWTKKYEKTKSGKIMRTYRNMKSRIVGILKKKAHLYSGLELLPKEDFYTWAFKDQSFNLLFNDWVQSGYCKKLSPSVDRIDTSLGYILGNIRWVTHSENSRLGASRRNRNV